MSQSNMIYTRDSHARYKETNLDKKEKSDMECDFKLGLHHKKQDDHKFRALSARQSADSFRSHKMERWSSKKD